MTIRDSLIALDRSIIEPMFQPMQDMVSGWRQQSDHLLAILFILASTGLWIGRKAFVDHDVLQEIGWVVFNTIAVAIIVLILFAYGLVYKNTNRPGVWADWPVLRFFFITTTAVTIYVYVTEPSLSTALMVGDKLTWAMGAYFGGVTLKRPPPPKRREETVSNFAWSGA